MRQIGSTSSSSTNTETKIMDDCTNVNKLNTNNFLISVTQSAPHTPTGGGGVSSQLEELSSSQINYVPRLLSEPTVTTKTLSLSPVFKNNSIASSNEEEIHNMTPSTDKSHSRNSSNNTIHTQATTSLSLYSSPKSTTTKESRFSLRSPLFRKNTSDQRHLTT